MRYYVTLAGEEIAVDVVRQPTGRLDVSVGGQSIEVDAVETDGSLNVRVGDRVFDLYLDGPRDGELVFAGAGFRATARVESERQRVGAAATRTQARGGKVCAPMPGRVVKVLVSEGDEVAAGQPVIVVEAMKMENELRAEQAGLVKAVVVGEGENVDSGATLVELAPIEA